MPDDGVLTGIPQPQRIKVARDLSALTQAEVTARMANPITPAALSQIEAGRVRPSGDTLQGLADALQIPADFFFNRWPSGSGDTLSSVVHFRDLAATPAKQRRRAAALGLVLNDLVSALELHVRIPDYAVPDFPITPDAPRSEVEAVAEAVRGEWDLPDEPIGHVLRQIELHGVPVARVTLGTDQVDAFAVRFGPRPLIILALDKSNYVRSRFDAAHELGHLIMHAHAPDGPRGLERQAHDFAASFLLPLEIARKELPRRLDSRTWTQLAELKRIWGMSMAALLYRARDIGVMTPEAYLTAMKYMSAKGWRRVEPGDREMGKPEAPTLLERALSTTEIELGVDQGNFVKSIGLPEELALSLIRTAIDPRPQIRI